MLAWDSVRDWKEANSCYDLTARARRLAANAAPSAKYEPWGRMVAGLDRKCLGQETLRACPLFGSNRQRPESEIFGLSLVFCRGRRHPRGFTRRIHLGAAYPP